MGNYGHIRSKQELH